MIAASSFGSAPVGAEVVAAATGAAAVDECDDHDVKEPDCGHHERRHPVEPRGLHKKRTVQHGEDYKNRETRRAASHL
jgi:hypothetical protein